MDSISTVDYIIKNRCSISRLGNGEMDIILGDNKHFQSYDEKLAKELKQLSTTNNMLLCVPFLLENKEALKNQNNNFWSDHRKNTLFYWRHFYNKNTLLGDACLTRFYIDLKTRENVADYVKKIKLIWERCSIVIVEGKLTRLGVGNDLFDNSKSIKRIICPSENAYVKIDTIESYIVKNVSKQELLVIALGPTASVLVSRLSKKGYQALDLGHIDIEYEWFLMGATEKKAIPGKYVNEVPGSGWNPSEEIANSEYKNQILIEL